MLEREVDEKVRLALERSQQVIEMSQKEVSEVEKILGEQAIELEKYKHQMGNFSEEELELIQ